MKSKLLLQFLILTHILAAQTFIEVSPSPPFDGVFFSSIAFSDVNGDGYEDVLITGLNNTTEPVAKLYINGGGADFSEKTGTPFEGVLASSVAFSDVNGDGYEDVLIAGLRNSAEPMAKLYVNDGEGNFSEMAGTPFEGVTSGSIAFSDVNGDGYDDVLITGRNSFGERMAKLFTNDGGGHFTEMTGTPFERVSNSSIAFSDVNSNGFTDVLIAGRNSSLEPVTKLYINSGSGDFTEMTGTPFEGVTSGSIAFSDVNGDGYDDVLITGENSLTVPIAKLYTNGGGGQFTETTGTPFAGVSNSSIAFSDVNGDGYDDVLITGRNNSFEPLTELYLNNGVGDFFEMTDTPFVGVSNSSIAFSDVNGDGHNDVLLTGETSLFERIAKLYTNDGMVSSTDEYEAGDRLSFRLFPNPSTSSTLFLSYNSTVRNEVTIKVYNLNGLLLRQQSEFAKIGQQIFLIDIGSLIPGSYFIELVDGKKTGVAPFFVE